MVCWTCVAVWLAVGSVIAYFFFSKKNKKQVEIRKHDWKPDIVYLYQFPRARSVPNLSTYCLKVETFLKANKIPYEVCPLLMGRSKYGLLPFIELNGEHIADSQIILHRLKIHFKVKPLPSPKDEALARTIERTTENHTAMVIYNFKIAGSSGNDYVNAMGIMPSLGLPEGLTPIIAPLVSYMIKSKASKRVATSIGNFSDEDFKHLLRKDLDTYRDLLAGKKFFFGDGISSADCTLFSQLATTIYIPVDNYAKNVIQDEYPELVTFCDNLRDKVFGKEFTEE
uniref:GST C-terminal domain-containing protein n=1 Tax=Haemonchus contortus TaxID=6289 RepID=A0A7I4YAY3_HAECO